ncbi:MAG: hypothetical protein L3J15_03290 [Devosiaceae bacterium]|nr:hypothetical protein [Devosiaceae bacterium]
MKISYWAKAMLSLGGILLAIGVLPLGIIGFLFPASQPIFLQLLFLSLAPIGAVIFFIGIIIVIFRFFKK